MQETIAYTRSDERLGVFCPSCETIVDMAVPHVASILAEVSEREVYRRIVSNQVHFIEGRRLLVCIRSLTDHVNAEDAILEA